MPRGMKQTKKGGVAINGWVGIHAGLVIFLEVGSPGISPNGLHGLGTFAFRYCPLASGRGGHVCTYFLKHD